MLSSWTALAETVGRALLHSLWQGAALAILVALVCGALEENARTCSLADSAAAASHRLRVFGGSD